MIDLPPIEDIARKRLLRSMQAFLEGEQSLPWILGVIGNQRALALELLVTRLSEYGDHTLYDELRQELERASQNRKNA